ncbi:Uncharacterized protein FVE85_0243 [Porphyridium purpureum]|uniref:Histone deacetylase domain-containing protein n=1 Tax=Porphyridium purpureum TaxID=35688 RepID=A0A5J4Z0N7_PORPP|nr:Uncharacterized protein FVE85_0243 [Porphyridium purpureum]|eukprot:POR7633..scf208_2
MLSRRVPVLYSPQFLEHTVPAGHPECPARLERTVQLLRDESGLELVEPVSIHEGGRLQDVMEAILRVHHQDHVDEIWEASERGGRRLDGDTFISSSSYQTALLAVSAWMQGIDMVLDSNMPAFVLARPPGHHATGFMSQGFCLFSNAAIAAKHALEKRGVGKVGVFDFDVHHGNGTESVVRKDGNMFYCSTHQSPLYPGTGAADFHGPLGNILNVPLPAGIEWREYEKVLHEQIVPFLVSSGAAKELLIVSAGYDTLSSDPLGGMSLQPADFERLAEILFDCVGHGRIMFGLEGGYSLDLAHGIPQAIRHTLMACAAQCAAE